MSVVVVGIVFGSTLVYAVLLTIALVTHARLPWLETPRVEIHDYAPVSDKDPLIEEFHAAGIFTEEEVALLNTPQWEKP